MNDFVTFTIGFNRVVPPTLLVCGVIGNVLSLMTFSNGILRSSPCSTYFFGLAITHLNNLLFGLLVNNLGDVYNVNILTATVTFCRIRFYILHGSLVLSAWFIVLASIDRYCISSSNVNRRQFSSSKNARVLVGISVLVCLVLYCHVLIYFTVYQTPLGLQCNPQPGIYATFYGFFFLITYSLTPPILMIVIGLATFYNTRQIRRQIHPSRGENVLDRLRKKDRQFIKMLFLQLIFCVILTLPIAIQKLYATFTQTIPKSSDRLFIENFFAQFVRTLTQVNSTLSFYLYTFSSSVFRLQFYHLLVRMIKFIFGTNNELYRRLYQIVFPPVSNQGTLTLRQVVTKRHEEQ